MPGSECRASCGRFSAEFRDGRGKSEAPPQNPPLWVPRSSQRSYCGRLSSNRQRHGVKKDVPNAFQFPKSSKGASHVFVTPATLSNKVARPRHLVLLIGRFANSLRPINYGQGFLLNAPSSQRTTPKRRNVCLNDPARNQYRLRPFSLETPKMNVADKSRVFPSLPGTRNNIEKEGSAKKPSAKDLPKQVPKPQQFPSLAPLKLYDL